MLPLTALAASAAIAAGGPQVTTDRPCYKRRDGWIVFRVAVPRRGQSLSLR